MTFKLRICQFNLMQCCMHKCTYKLKWGDASYKLTNKMNVYKSDQECGFFISRNTIWYLICKHRYAMRSYQLYYQSLSRSWTINFVAFDSYSIWWYMIYDFNLIIDTHIKSISVYSAAWTWNMKHEHEFEHEHKHD